jgi:phosphate acetyltransferase
MTPGLYIVSTDANSGKSLVALGIMELLSRSVERVGIFRPVIESSDEPDNDIALLRTRYQHATPYEASYAVTHDEARQMVAAAQHRELLDRVYSAYREFASHCEFVICEGTDFTGLTPAFEFDFNARVAIQLACPVLIVVNGQDRSSGEVISLTRAARESFLEEGCTVTAMIVNRVRPTQHAQVIDALSRDWPHADPVYVVPEHPTLGKPTLVEVVRHLGAQRLHGADGWQMNEVLDTKIAAMTVAHYLDHLVDGCLVITPGDRSDIILSSWASIYSEGSPTLVGMVLTGGLDPAPQVLRVVDGLKRAAVPLFTVQGDTYDTALKASAVRAKLAPDNDRKIATALGLFEAHVDTDALRRRITSVRSTRVTPLMFTHTLVERAKANRQHIVLPEGTDERILRATEIILRRGIADITLLGDPREIREIAATSVIDIGAAGILDPAVSDRLEEFARTYFQLRQHKGVNEDIAHDVMRDVSYFGTMMVYQGEADGMVSGATHTTAHTIRPALEFIRTQPGRSMVSSVFFMCLADRVLVYGDCAVIPNPTAEQLADIAISSAATAAIFGIEPRVAMLSYATGDSGGGEDVDRVRQATRIARSLAPDLPIEGPIQYDAAVDASVAKTKMANSEVAGRATVFIFPDLNTGNNTYKAVQRSAGAIAVGPVLQGLKKPVNDLSRGCTVADIVNTVAITAIQAQHAEK